MVSWSSNRAVRSNRLLQIPQRGQLTSMWFFLIRFIFYCSRVNEHHDTTSRKLFQRHSV